MTSEATCSECVCLESNLELETVRADGLCDDLRDAKNEIRDLEDKLKRATDALEEISSDAEQAWKGLK